MRIRSAGLVVALLGVPSPVSGQDTGAAIYRRLTNSYPFTKPYIGGFLGGAARLDWFIPRTEWNRLSPAEQAAIVRYMPRLVEKARHDPDPYLDLPPTAPAYSRALSAVQEMSDGQWAIGVGTPKGRGASRTITLDETVVCGPEAADCAGEPSSQVLARSGVKQSRPVAPLPESKPAPPDPEATYVAGLFQNGVFYDVRGSGDAVELLVGPKFYLLSIDEKQRATQAAWNKTFKGREEWGVLFLKDSRSGKEIGRHTRLKGLTLY